MMNIRIIIAEHICNMSIFYRNLQVLLVKRTEEAVRQLESTKLQSTTGG